MSSIIGGNNGMFSHPMLPKLETKNYNEGNNKLQQTIASYDDSVSIGKNGIQNEPVLSFKYDAPKLETVKSSIDEPAKKDMSLPFNLNSIESVAENGIFYLSL